MSSYRGDSQKEAKELKLMKTSYTTNTGASTCCSGGKSDNNAVVEVMFLGQIIV